MARPLRIEYPSACYHVINRGNRGDRIFFYEDDYRLFFNKLSEYTELYDVVIYSYCLMPNHFHLQLKTIHPNLSKFMQAFSTSYTTSINLKYNKPGHLFQGRYKAQVVESELYKNELSRYIHLNPAKTKVFEKSSLQELKKIIHNYKWSSFREYIGICKKPDWLNRNFILSGWGWDAEEKMIQYRKYVEEGLLTDNSNKIEPSKIHSIIGSDSFKDKIIKKYLIRDLADIDEREQPVLLVINTFAVKDIIKCIAEYYNLDDFEKITNRKACNKNARKLAILLSAKYCRKTNSLTTIAKHFELKLTGFNSTRYRFELNLKLDKRLQETLRTIEKKLKKIHKCMKE